MRQRWPWVILVSAFALVAIACVPTQDDRAGQRLSITWRSILFSSDRDGNPEIYMMRADGGEQKRLTYHPADDYAPVWSPGGPGGSGLIAFQSDRDGNVDLYLMRVPAHAGRLLDRRDAGPHRAPGLASPGREIVRLTRDGGWDLMPEWSPDGTRILFASSRSGGLDLYVINTDGSGLKRLTHDPGNEASPAWSPDGTKIVFTTDRAGDGGEICIVAVGVEGMRCLTRSPAADWHAAWSPDGQRIAFSSEAGGNRDIYVLPVTGVGEAEAAGGEGLVRLTSDPGDDITPAWSPDGQFLAFASDREGQYDIYVMRADGSHLTRLTDSPGDDRVPSWGP